jgi:serine acetyltransferase
MALMQNLRADFARVRAVEEGRTLYRSLHALCAPGFHAVLVYRFLYLLVRICWGIGPNAVEHEDIPDNAVVALDPGYRIVSNRGNRRARSSMPGDRRRSASTG